MGLLGKLIVPLVVVALVVAALVTFVLGGSDQKTLTADFPRAVSLYEGSDVRVLGVPVGKVDSVTPSGTQVIVKMHYDSSVQIPANAKAVIISPSIVGDRFVQLTPAYSGGQVLTDGATLQQSRTAVPLELDQIYSSLDDLTTALGPNGANKKGALTDLLDTTAANFGGQGEKFHRTIQNFGKLSGTLADNKDNLFGSVRELEGFVRTLAHNDHTVRSFNQTLADVSHMLKGERGDLAASLHNLGIAMKQVSGFVRDNREILGKNIAGLDNITQILVRQRKALAETLQDAPLALNNLALTYNPQAGTLDTRANLGEIGHQITSDPATFLCGILDQANQGGQACQAVKQLLAKKRPAALSGSARRTRGVGVDLMDPTLGGLVEAGR
jgi:phospholipid/cholesterol/gamma-HCH transport system substrate-binding protein